jgi:hypothetical protein
MKKIYTLFVLLFFALVINSQSITHQYLDISEICGDDIAIKINQKEDVLKSFSNKKTEIKIIFLPILNSQGEYTKISQNISQNLANKVQQTIKNQISRFNSITIEYVKNQNPNCDFYFKANYYITETNFVIDNISISKPDNSGSFSLALSTCKLNTDLNIDNVVIPFNSYYVESKELNFSTETQIIKNEVISMLSINNYFLEDEIAKANYKISITGNAVENNKVYGVYFSTVNTTIKVINTSNNNTVYQKTYTQKGGNPNSFSDAANNAYIEGSKIIVDELVTFLSKY